MVRPEWSGSVISVQIGGSIQLSFRNRWLTKQPLVQGAATMPHDLVKIPIYPFRTSGLAPPGFTAPVLESEQVFSVRSLIKARGRRGKFFKASLFSDPAWDILLELFAAELEGRKVSITTVGLTAHIPPTTALRWIGALEQEGLLRRANDPLDRRRSFVSLSDDGSRAMALYMQASGITAHLA